MYGLDLSNRGPTLLIPTTQDLIDSLTDKSNPQEQLAFLWSMLLETLQQVIPPDADPQEALLITLLIETIRETEAECQPSQND